MCYYYDVRTRVCVCVCVCLLVCVCLGIGYMEISNCKRGGERGGGCGTRTRAGRCPVWPEVAVRGHRPQEQGAGGALVPQEGQSESESESGFIGQVSLHKQGI